MEIINFIKLGLDLECNPLFNIIEENGDVTSLFSDGTIAFNNWEVTHNQKRHLEIVPEEVLKEWEEYSL